MSESGHYGVHLGDPDADLWGLVLAFRRGERPNLSGLTAQERRVFEDIADRRRIFAEVYTGVEHRHER